MINRAFANVAMSLLVVAVAATGLTIQTQQAAAAPTTCGGFVFHDYDADGERAEDYSHVSDDYANWLDDPVPGIDVTITTEDGTELSAVTDANGAWTIGLDTNDFPIRIDFSGLDAGWESRPIGPDSGPLTQFVNDASECGTGSVGNAGVGAPGSFCENQPDLATTCFLFGNVADHDNMAAIVTLPDGAVDNQSTAGSGFQDDPYVVQATLGEVGSVYGIATNYDGSIYGASFVKRHTQLGPTDNPTTIYWIDPAGTVSEFYTTDPTAVNPHSGDTDGWLNDFAAFDDVGKSGLGDVAVSDDGNTMHVVDLGQKQLVTIPINADGSANGAGVVRTDITSAALGAPCADPDLRPFGLGFLDDGTLLVSATCTAESTTVGQGPANAATGPVLGDPAQLSAAIYSFSGTGFAWVVDVPIPTTSRGTQNGTNDFQALATWHPWVSEAPYARNFTGWPGGGVAYPQPLVSDITQDGDDLIIGIMDIWGHQMGSNAFYQRGGTIYQVAQPLSSGDLIRAEAAGASYTFPTSGADYFYTGDNYGTSHTETALGSPVQIPGRPYSVTNAFDPINPSNTWQSGGLEWFANETTPTHNAGEHVRGYRLYDGGPGSPVDVGSFEKAAGIGDVQVLCGEAPIEVGNRVWVDADRDGIADPAEVSVVGAVVELLDNSGTVIATTTTDANGLYYFHSDAIAGFDRNDLDYQIRLAQVNYDAGGIFAAGGAYEDTPITTVDNAGSDDGNDSDAVDVNGLPTINFTASNTDHTMDIGVTSSYDLALTKVYTSDTSGAPADGVITTGADVTFTITVFNQGSIDAATFEVTDYIPAGFSLNDGAWTPGAGNTATFTGGPLAAGASTTVDITLTADSATAGDFVNWAEISNDSGDDIDSTPDSDQANDVQPIGPGAAGDDVTDNSGGDEDDHDPAGVSVANYDLALTKVYTSDTSGDATDGVIVPGADVTFTITVFNQGTIDATTFEVTDYLPSGFTLNDGAWTPGAGNAATFTGGPLAAGASTTIDITMTAGAASGDFVNWAEISSDDGDDIDSAPDADQANDAQPTGPGATGDDVTDNSGGDEDDHDPAGVSVSNYDLALTKVYTSDTYGGPADGVIQQGADVTFTITVENQGSIDANTFTVTDYLPAGFALNDAAWTPGAGNTATFTGGPLVAGTSTTIDITMTADSVAPGDFVNWAEISADDGDDTDSTPDTDQANDVQPTGPGAAGDNVTDNSGGDEDDHDPAGVTVELYDLALTKVYTSDTFGDPADGIIEEGSDVTFTITVFNQGSVDAGTFEVTDYIPAGFSLNDAAWTPGAGNTATFTGGPLAAGASTTVDITLTADSVAPGEFVNWAEISNDDGDDADSTADFDQANDVQPTGPGAAGDDVTDNTDGDEDDHDPAGVSVANYDLALTKVYTSDTSGDATDGEIVPGADVTFTITVENQGTIDATTFEVTDYLPAGFTLNDGAWTPGAGNTATITGGPLAAGASTTLTITTTAGATTGDFVNWAEISSDDGNDVDSTPDADPANDSQPTAPGQPTDNVTDNTDGDEDDHDPAGVSVQFYDLALTKVYTSDTHDGPADGVVAPGADVTFTITVFNQGTVDAATFEITDYLPAGFTLNDAAWTPGAGNTATFTGGPLAAGASTTIEIAMTAGAATGDFVNWAEISSDSGDDIDSTPDASQGNDSQPARPGEPTDNVVDNTAGDEDDHDPAGVSVEFYDLALTKVYTSDTFGDPADAIIEQGNDVTFTITVFNQGSVDATTFEVTDYIPAGFLLNDAAWTPGAGNTATIAGGPLVAGASTTFDITLTADSVAPGQFVNWAEISADDGFDVDSAPDIDQANDSQPAAPGEPTDNVTDNTDGDEDDHDPAGVSVANYDLALTKVYTSDTHGAPTDGVVENGADVTFTITVFNQGTIDATTFEITDYLPAGFVLNDGAWTPGAGNTATFTGGPLAAGASTTLTITLTADSATTGDFVNWAEISSDDGNDVDSTPDADQTNDTQPTGPGATGDDVTNNADGDEDDHDPAGVTVETYDLALTKVYTSDSFGDPTDAVIDTAADVTFTITVFNQGSVDATTFEVTDYLPAGFTLNDPAWTDNANGTATITGGPLAAGDSVDLEVTMTAGVVAPGGYVNGAEISSDDGNDADSSPNSNPADDNQPSSPGDPTDNVTDNTSGDEDDHDIAGVGVQNFDLALIKVLSDDGFGDPADGLTEAGSDVTFTITAINQGTIDAGTFEVTDYLPAGFVLNDAAWTDNGDNTATIAGGPLAAGESVDIEITLASDGVAPGGAINIAEISSDDGSDIDSTPDTDPADDAQPGSPGDPTDDVTNNSDGDSDDHDISGVTIGEFDLALTKVYTSDTSADGNAADGRVQVGDDVTFTITVINQGTLDADNFSVVDYIPAGLGLNDAAWTDNGDNTATITGGPLAAGASVDLTVTMTVTAAIPGQLVNGAEISSDTATDIDSTPDADPADDNQPAAPGDATDNVTDNTDGDEDDHDIAGLTVDVYDLALVKDFTSDTSADGSSTDGVIQAGDNATFTITVTNEGTVDANNVEVTDYLPAGFTLNDAAWTDNGDGTATRNVGAIPVGGSVSVDITLNATSTGAGPLVNWAEISTDDGEDVDSTPNTNPDDDGTPPSEDDIDDAPLTVDAYDLALRKVYTSDSYGAGTDGVITPGSDITFTITVFNQGTVDATNVEVTDFYPLGFVLSAISADSAAWTDNGSGGAVTTIGSIPAGGSASVNITLTAIAPTFGDNLNMAEISSDDGVDVDSTPNADPGDDGSVTDDEVDNAAGDEDDHDPAPFTVVEELPIFDLALRKTLQNGANSGTVTAGQTVTWTVTVFNQGETHASNIDIIDYIPSGLRLADSDWTETADGDATINIAGPIAPGGSVSVDVTTTVVDGSDLTNLAEIESADAVDGAGAVILGANGEPLADIDSIPDGTNSEVPVDDEVNNTGGDEDDHDGAVVTLTTPTPAPTLPATGTSLTLILLAVAAALMTAGVTLLRFERRKEIG